MFLQPRSYLLRTVIYLWHSEKHLDIPSVNKNLLVSDFWDSGFGHLYGNGGENLEDINQTFALTPHGRRALEMEL